MYVWYIRWYICKARFSSTQLRIYTLDLPLRTFSQPQQNQKVSPLLHPEQRILGITKYTEQDTITSHFLFSRSDY
jgi:hypothetical protein